MDHPKSVRVQWGKSVGTLLSLSGCRLGLAEVMNRPGSEREAVFYMQDLRCAVKKKKEAFTAVYTN